MIVVFPKSLIVEVKSNGTVCFGNFQNVFKKSSSGNMSKPQNHQLITAVEFLLVFSRLIGFSLA